MSLDRTLARMDEQDVYSDSLAESQARWDEMKDDRAQWTREAWRDKQVLAGDVFNNREKEAFRDMERDIPNYNLALPMRNIIAGTEAQNRSDIKYQPIGPSDVDGAKALTQVVRKVSRSNDLGRQMTVAFGNALDTGIGWVEVGYNRYVTGERITIGTEDPFNVWVDPACRKTDLTDASDIVRMKKLRPKQLARILPKQMHRDIQQLKGMGTGADGTDWSHSADHTNETGDYPDVNDDRWGSTIKEQRGRSRLLEVVERWYRVDRFAPVVRHLDGRWWEVKQENAHRLAEMIMDGEAKEEDGMVPEIRYTMFCEDMLIGDWASPYTHRQFPLIPIWCYQDENGRPMSIVRLMRTAAKDFNARMANMLQRAMMRQVWVEDGAFTDLDKALEEIAMPDGVVMLKPGSLKNQRVLFRDELEASAVEANLLQMDLRVITDLSGVTQEMAGQHSNADSGVAIQKKITQSQTALYTLFDNRSTALRAVGVQLQAAVQAIHTDEQDIRITESGKGIEWLRINKRAVQPDGSVLVENDITSTEFDTEVSEVPMTESVRMAQFEALTAFLTPLPTEVKLLFASKMAELADIPDAEEVSQKIEAFAQRVLGMGEAAAPPIDPALLQQLVAEGQLTPEGAAAIEQAMVAAMQQPQGQPPMAPTQPTPAAAPPAVA